MPGLIRRLSTKLIHSTSTRHRSSGKKTDTSPLPSIPQPPHHPPQPAQLSPKHGPDPAASHDSLPLPLDSTTIELQTARTISIRRVHPQLIPASSPSLPSRHHPRSRDRTHQEERFSYDLSSPTSSPPSLRSSTGTSPPPPAPHSPPPPSSSRHEPSGEKSHRKTDSAGSAISYYYNHHEPYAGPEHGWFERVGIRQGPHAASHDAYSLRPGQSGRGLYEAGSPSWEGRGGWV